VDNEPVEEAQLFGWLAKELGVDEPGQRDEEARNHDRRAVGSKRCSNRLLRESGYAFRFPTYREGYGDLMRLRSVR
jgi:hypothetical protein